MIPGLADYLRCALVVDDVIELQGVALDELAADDDLVDAEPEEGLIAPDDIEIDDMPLIADEIERAFLEAGLLCAVHRVDDPDALESDAFRSVAAKADLLVLDWFIVDQPTATVSLVEHLAGESGTFRIVAILTGSPDLAAVSARLVRDTDLELADPENEFVLKCGSLFVSILGKPGPTRIGIQATREVPYSDIPQRLLDDFETVIDGILPAVAFGAVNGVRASIPRLLGRFSGDLDAGLLLHRMLLPNVADAADHVTAALADSLGAAIQRSGVATLLEADVLRDLVDPYLAVVDDAEASDWRSSLDEIRKRVVDGLALHGPKPNRSRARGAVRVFASPPDVHDEFGLLMSTSDSPIDHLTQGWVLWDGSEYILCVQPRCDSVRLDQRDVPADGSPVKVEFSFVALAAEEKSSKHIVVPSVDSGIVRLGFANGVEALRLHTFAVEEGEDRIRLAEPGEGLPFFKTHDGLELRGVATLRAELARMAVENLVNSMARIGANPSEFIRLSTQQ